jgi:hypothetical protein
LGELWKKDKQDRKWENIIILADAVTVIEAHRLTKISSGGFEREGLAKDHDATLKNGGGRRLARRRGTVYVLETAYLS